ncbi:MAG: nucleoside phosphorylase [Bacteroidales bacterium]|jgi:uridine phosphorylase|nr:nucleoside phosphorylase [Bacteroidales bacterium]
MNNQKFAASELVLAPDNSLYHLRLNNNEIAEKVILVGEPERVEKISYKFDNITLKRENRGLITHCGTYKGKLISVIATGMGTGNIDIVLTELDAAVNINLKTKQPFENTRQLDIVRIGTCGSMQKNIDCNEFVASQYVIGIDGTFDFYADDKEVVNKDLTNRFMYFMNWNKDFAKPYAVDASENLLKSIAFDMHRAITITAPGFFAPQGRSLRLNLADNTINNRLPLFSYKNIPVVNYEMETSLTYALGRALGHNVLTVCCVVANRVKGEFLEDYAEKMDILINNVLNRI